MTLTKPFAVKNMSLWLLWRTGENRAEFGIILNMREGFSFCCSGWFLEHCWTELCRFLQKKNGKCERCDCIRRDTPPHHQTHTHTHPFHSHQSLFPLRCTVHIKQQAHDSFLRVAAHSSSSLFIASTITLLCWNTLTEPRSQRCVLQSLGFFSLLFCFLSFFFSILTPACWHDGTKRVGTGCKMLSGKEEWQPTYAPQVGPKERVSVWAF